MYDNLFKSNLNDLEKKKKKRWLEKLVPTNYHVVHENFILATNQIEEPWIQIN
jgi:hypothetical protein